MRHPEEQQENLERLRAIIEQVIKDNLPFKDSVIGISLTMIRRNHGSRAEEETRQIFRLDTLQ
ncbi:hypothetical protein [Geoalkalibacter halelectricus]|uniref:hypothetical protein n=1 Tax=Geoalkalibacter halelectricus TaxID=2847045 RepID=UPI00266FF9E7|nr:hypothetical protein [Geoalkalibacter halelectricus]MDO3380390.1 hypothetical protein [Geoalkalibacter halelectricus]